MSDRLRLGNRPRPPLLSWDSGPGLRWLLFTQGCRTPCTDRCLNPHYLASEGGQLVTLAELLFVADLLASGLYGPVEGVTVLGGEPTDQAATLAPFLQSCRAAGLGTMVYTGRPLDWVERNAPMLLPHVDLLVDGPFLPALADPSLRWRGSTNQRLLLLTSRYQVSTLAAEMAHRGMTLSLHPGAPSTVSGLQDRKAAEAIERIIAGR